MASSCCTLSGSPASVSFQASFSVIPFGSTWPTDAFHEAQFAFAAILDAGHPLVSRETLLHIAARHRE
jgi:hypothetical protein